MSMLLAWAPNGMAVDLATWTAIHADMIASGRARVLLTEYHRVEISTVYIGVGTRGFDRCTGLPLIYESRIRGPAPWGEGFRSHPTAIDALQDHVMVMCFVAELLGAVAREG